MGVMTEIPEATIARLQTLWDQIESLLESEGLVAGMLSVSNGDEVMPFWHASYGERTDIRDMCCGHIHFLYCQMEEELEDE